MKAAVCYEFGKPLVVEDIDIDPPKKGEVKVRLAATAICHTDIHNIKGERGGNLPLVPGHESSGYIEEVGEGVTSVKPGDHVVVSLVSSCGKCQYCTTGLPHLCTFEWPLSKESRLHNKQGQSLRPLHKTATFAEYAIVDQSQTVKIPDDMPMDRAALLGCGVITGFGAVINRFRIKPLSSIVVVGTGGVGLNSIQGAAFVGAYPIIAVDHFRSENKLRVAKAFGATHTVNPKQEDPVAAVKKITGGTGADYVFVTAGNTAAAKTGLSVCGYRGTTILIGLPPASEPLSFVGREFMRGERMLTGCRMGSIDLAYDIPKLVALYKAGRLKLDELITGKYPLDKINDAIDSVLRGEALRHVIMFE